MNKELAIVQDEITVDNCIEVMGVYEPSGDIKAQAQAWQLLHDLCLHKGMLISDTKAGIQDVVEFINININK